MHHFQQLIGPDRGTPSIAQFFARALSMLDFGIACMRIAGGRTFSSLSPLDIFIAIVVGSNVSRVMIGNVPFAAALAATLLVVVMHRLLAVATLRSNLLARFIKGRLVTLARGFADLRPCAARISATRTCRGRADERGWRASRMRRW